MQINIKKLTSTATIPTQADPGAAGYDLYADESKVLPKQTSALIKTGIILAIPAGYYGRIAPRSGLAIKHGIDILGGVIDSSYRGEIGVIIYNTSKEDVTIEAGMRIAQLIIERCYEVIFQEVDILDQTSRGEGGFGSTGI